MDISIQRVYFSSNQRINLCSIYFFFGSTSDFAFSTSISFNAIYFRSTIYITVVDHYCLVPLDLVRSREAGTQLLVFNTFCIQYILVSFNAIASVLFNFKTRFCVQQFLFRSTRFTFVQRFIAQRLSHTLNTNRQRLDFEIK